MPDPAEPHRCTTAARSTHPTPTRPTAGPRLQPIGEIRRSVSVLVAGMAGAALTAVITAWAR